MDKLRLCITIGIIINWHMVHICGGTVSPSLSTTTILPACTGNNTANCSTVSPTLSATTILPACTGNNTANCSTVSPTLSETTILPACTGNNTANCSTVSPTLSTTTILPAVTIPAPTDTTPTPAITTLTPAVTIPAPAVTTPTPAVTTPTPAVTTPTPAVITPTPAVKITTPAVTTPTLDATTPTPAVTTTTLAVTTPTLVVTTPTPAVTTPTPAVTTPAQAVTIPTPAVTTTAPAVTTPTPAVTTPTPAITTPTPAVTTPTLAVTTLTPAVMTPVPVFATTTPAVTTPAPVVTTPVTVVTTAAPVVTTPVQVATTPAPVVTTPALVVTTPALVVTTPAPVVTTPAPVVTTPAPVVTTPAPVVTTPALVVTTPAPVVTTPAPVVTTPAPVVTTPAPVVTTPAPVVTTPAPVVTTPAPVVTTPAPVVTTPSPGAYVYAKTEVNIAVPSQVEINATFSNDLKNHTSPIFNEYKTTFQKALADSYKDVKGFRYVLVHNFTAGSIVCNYDVLFQGNSDLAEEVNINVHDVNVTLDNKKYELKINRTEITTVFQQVAKNSGCQYVQTSCGEEYQKECRSDSILCVPPCDQPNAVKCSEHGTCVYDHRTKSTACRCKESDSHVFSGKFCEVTVEKLQLESKYIVAIAVSVGGVVVIAAAVAIVCLIYRPRRRKTFKEADESGENIGLDHLRRSSRTRSENSYEEFRGRHTSKETTSNGSIDGITRSRSEVTKVVDGMEHKVTTDEKGNEVYIYQPKQPRDLGRQRQPSVYPYASEENASQTGSSAYDYIDTGIKYQIRRPNLSIRTIRI